VSHLHAGKESTKYTAPDACPAGVRTKGGSSWTRNWLKFDNECAPPTAAFPLPCSLHDGLRGYGLLSRRQAKLASS
jgi:hypothetical protein